MSKQLEIKRDQAVKEMETLIAGAKERALSTEEKEKFTAYKKEAEDLNERINQERYVLDQQKKETPKSFDKDEQKLNAEYSVGRALKNIISGRALEGAELEAMQEAEKELKSKGMARQNPNSILIPSMVVNQRATNTVSNQSSLVKTNLLDPISMVQYPVIFNQVATVWNDVPNGSFAIPSLQNIIASYAATDSTASDISLSSAVKSLPARWMQAAGGFTKDFLASSTDSMQSQLFGFFQYAIARATDKQMMFDLTGATTAAVYVTGSTNTYKGVLKLVNGIPNSNAFISSKRGATFLQTTPTISGSTSNAQPIWSVNNTVAGISAYASFDAPNGLYAVGDFKQYHIPVWSSAYEVIVDPYTEARKGNIILQVSKVQNQGVGNAAAFAVGIGGSFI